MKISPYFLVLALSISACTAKPENKTSETIASLSSDSELDTATFAGGCFWCVEASFDQIIGVKEAVSGYAGGTAYTADYKKVSSGQTNHTETVQVYYDPTVIDYATLLDIFFTAHDPTQLNRQGPDVGRQYRSSIFYHDAEQKAIAESKIAELQKSTSGKIVTEIVPIKAFYIAEDYHQNYERNNPFQPYVMSVSKPKIERVKRKFEDRIKVGY
ncbi:MAG: peptide-methionine (S)-S-oxide reductase [Marinoscillum sp.]|jgi:peptide-methionine (S)-S-oxide reductase